MTRVLALLLSLAAATAAGCLGGEADPAPAGTAAPAGGGNATEAEPIVLYSMDDIVAGASAPHPSGAGALAGPVPLAKVDRFVVEEGVGNLTFEGGLPTGSGAGRIDVLDPSGALVWSSDQMVLVGAPGVLGVGLASRVPVEAPAAWPAGEYEVRYYVAGAMQATLEVQGVPGAATPATPAA